MMAKKIKACMTTAIGKKSCMKMSSLVDQGSAWLKGLLSGQNLPKSRAWDLKSVSNYPHPAPEIVPVRLNSGGVAAIKVQEQTQEC